MRVNYYFTLIIYSNLCISIFIFYFKYYFCPPPVNLVLCRTPQLFISNTKAIYNGVCNIVRTREEIIAKDILGRDFLVIGDSRSDEGWTTIIHRVCSRHVTKARWTDAIRGVSQWKSCILEATLLKPRDRIVPSNPSPLPAGRKLDKTSVENFRYFFRRRARNHTARSFCCRLFSRGDHFSRANAVLLVVDTVRRCFARRSGVKLENNGSRRLPALAHQIFRLKGAAGRFSMARSSFCGSDVSEQ